jgi:hypothetical protein
LITLKTSFLLALVLISTISFASDEQWDRMIIEKILSSLDEQNKIAIQVENSELYKNLKNSKILHIHKDCTDIDFVLTSKKLKRHCDKPHIVFNYHEFLKDPNAIAVFFWKKGRPTISFSSLRLKKYGLHVNGELSRFVSSKY